MPAKNTTLAFGKRHNPLNRKLYKAFIEKTCINIDYAVFLKIVQRTNELINKAIIEEESGVKLPENLGYVIVTKYKSRRTPIDWKNTRLYNKKIPHLNLHSFGFIHHIRWFKIMSKCSNIFIYKFRPYRTLKRELAKNVKEGKKYFQWENSDLWSSTKMERRFTKFFKK